MRAMRDLFGSLLVAAVVVTYVVVLGGGSVALAADPRGVAAVGLVLGLAACIVAGESMTVATPAAWRAITGVLAVQLSAVSYGPPAPVGQYFRP
jgi:hypothetical protein